MRKSMLAAASVLAIFLAGSASAATGSWTGTAFPPRVSTSGSTVQNDFLPPSNVPTNAVITSVTYQAGGYFLAFGATETVTLCYTLPTGVSYGNCQAASKSGGSYAAPIGKSARSRFRFNHTYTGAVPVDGNKQDTITVNYSY